MTTMCRVLRISRHGYYSWLRRSREGPSNRVQADRQLVVEIRQIHEDSGERYGLPRILAGLRRQGRKVGPVRVARLMVRADIRGSSGRQSVGATRADGSVAAEDLVQRQFRAERPNQLWVADATYLPTRDGTLSLAVILDVYSRRIVGWSMSSRQRSGLRVSALMMAVHRRRPTGAVIHHSDRGSQYTSAHFRAACQDANITLSMGSVGDCYDNAMVESFFGTLEKELIAQQPRRRFANRAAARSQVFEYLEGFYNPKRFHSALGYRSPVEFENHHQRLEEVQI